jgi:GNAT superfamily N-acetyltransferase
VGDIDASAIRVARVDVADQDALHAWWDVGRIASAHDEIDDYWPAWPTAWAGWSRPDPVRRFVRLAAHDGERVVGIASVQLEDADNDHLAIVRVMVLPDRRGRGIGSVLAEAVEHEARADARSTVLSSVIVPAGFAPDGSDHPDLDFARHRGYDVAGHEEVKVADLAATEYDWPALAARAAEKAGGYQLACWTDRAPEEHVAGIAHLYSRFLGEIPLGDVALRPAVWTVERIRDSEERWLASGRHQVLVAAVAPDGTLAGYTNLFVLEGRPERAGIDSTLVLPEHRGHRLGLALKVRLHQETRARHPEVTRVATANAGVNRWMNAVNDLLGYRVVETSLDVQKVLE